MWLVATSSFQSNLMPAQFSNLCPAAGRLLSHPWVCLLAFVALVSVSCGQVSAAGCSHRESTVVGLDPDGNPLPENVIKVYSGGEFRYYAVPNGKTCNGPSCNSAPATRMDSIPVVNISERADLSFLAGRSYSSFSLYCDRFLAWPDAWPVSLVLDGLLRPPTA